jgi:hypothetical protein
MWLQHNDDLLFDKSKQRKNVYDKIKLPLFVSALVLLIKELDINKCINVFKIILQQPYNVYDNIQKFNVPSFDGPSFNGPSFDGPSFDGPKFNGPSFDGPKFDDIFTGPPNF